MGSSNMQRFEKEENAKVLSCFPSTAIVKQQLLMAGRKSRRKESLFSL
jgi:hypothetical protein